MNYAYLTTGELNAITQSGTSLASYGYDNLGNRTSVTFANGASQAFAYDPVSRLASLTNALTDTNDLSATFAYNPASQITQTTRTGDMYAWRGLANESTAYDSNGLNQLTSAGGAYIGWDFGNLGDQTESGTTYGYSNENLLSSSSGSAYATLHYDAAMRLYQIASVATTRFAYDGADAIAEYNGTNALQRRFVFDPTTGQPVIWFEGTGVAATNRRYLSQDERGSVISVSGSTGTSLGINTYDEFGRPGAANIGRYQYTGQKWIGEAKLYDYKARDYLPQFGIFTQPDPIGYAGDGPNLYAYVLNNPVNFGDPLGLSCDGTNEPSQECQSQDSSGAAIVITGARLPGPSVGDTFRPSLSSPTLGTPAAPGGGGACGGDCSDIVVTGKRPHLKRLSPKQEPIIVTSPRIYLAAVAAAPPGYDPSVNYCGAEGGRRFPKGTWNGACAAHDECYGQQAGKTHCDINLGVEVMEQCIVGNAPMSVLIPQVCALIGLIYGGAVYGGGQNAYDNSKKR